MSAQTLRVFQPPVEEPPGGISADMTLPEFCREIYIPHIQSRAQPAREQTIREYRTTMRWWVKLMGEPPLSRIDKYAVRRFEAQLTIATQASGAPLTTSTVRKHVTHVKAVLRLAGPDTGNAEGLGLIEHVAVRLPKIRNRPKASGLTRDDVCDVLASCHRFRLPKPSRTGVKPDLWWRGLILLLYYTGLRIGAASRLHWRDLRHDPEHGGAVLEVRDEISKHRCGQMHYLHPQAWQAVQKLRRSDLPQVFLWPSCDSPIEQQRRNALRNLSRTHRSMIDELGIELAPKSNFHAYRRLHSTLMGQINGLASELSLGHTSGSVTREFYISPELLRESVLEFGERFGIGSNEAGEGVLRTEGAAAPSGGRSPIPAR